MTARRSTIAAVAAIVSLTVTATLFRPPAPARAADRARDLVRLACSLSHEELLRTWRGWRPDRGANLQVIPQQPNFVGSGLPHVGPWDYIQTVPMFWYGPGFIRERGRVDRPVTVADISATQAELLHFDEFRAPDGEVMSEAVIPTERTPKLVVVLVWDAGGTNVLQEHRQRLAVSRVPDPAGHMVRRRDGRVVADVHRADPHDDGDGRVPEPSRPDRPPLGHRRCLDHAVEPRPRVHRPSDVRGCLRPGNRQSIGGRHRGHRRTSTWA